MAKCLQIMEPLEGPFVTSFGQLNVGMMLSFAMDTQCYSFKALHCRMFDYSCVKALVS